MCDSSASSVRWVCITPLGSLVVPEVYASTHTSSGSAARDRVGRRRRAASTTSHPMRRTRGASARDPRTRRRRAARVRQLVGRGTVDDVEVVDVAVAVGRDVRAGAALREDEAHFLVSVDVHDRHEDVAAHREAVERDDGFSPVRQLERDDVARLEAGVRKRGDEPQRVGVDLGVRPVPRPRLRPDVHGRVGRGAQRSIDEAAERLVGPPPLGEVPRRAVPAGTGRYRPPRRAVIGSSVATTGGHLARAERTFAENEDGIIIGRHRRPGNRRCCCPTTSTTRWGRRRRRRDRRHPLVRPRRPARPRRHVPVRRRAVLHLPRDDRRRAGRALLLDVELARRRRAAHDHGQARARRPHVELDERRDRAGRHASRSCARRACSCSARPTSPIVAFAGGSGITPVMSIVKTALATTTRSITLVYANRSVDSVIFADDLERLRRDVGRPADACTITSTRSAASSTPRSAPRWSGVRAHADFYVCGPGAVHGRGRGRPRDASASTPAQVFIERFESPAVEADDAVAEARRATESLVVRLDRRKHTLALPGRRHHPRGGPARRPATAVLVRGRATARRAWRTSTRARSSMRANNALSAEEVDDGWILTCQAVPTSAEVVVDYDA